VAGSFDVRIWSIRVYEGSTRKTYTVRWTVEGRTFAKTFGTKGLAESWRSGLMCAQRKGESFDTEVGLPEAELRERAARITWYQHATAFIDMKWPSLEAGSRRTLAESLATITCGLVDKPGGFGDTRVLFRALAHWAFNTTARKAGDPPEKYAEAIEWIERHSIRLNALSHPRTARHAFECTLKAPDGTPFKASTATNKRKALSGAIQYAIELGYLPVDPITKISTPRQRRSVKIDRRVVVNPEQARALLNAVAGQGGDSQALVAFFATMYYAGLRPGEVVALREYDLDLPEAGWGELRFQESSPYSGSAWTDSGVAAPRKSLKHRNEGECRIVPAHPELVDHLRRHLDTFGTTEDGRLFVNGRGKPLTYGRCSLVWERARRQALTEAQFNSPLAGRPYDLRHAAVSTWLNAGVPAPQVAEWAGHSVAILLSTYAKCIDGQEKQARDRIAEALKPRPAGTGDPFASPDT
jgi:integrase